MYTDKKANSQYSPNVVNINPSIHRSSSHTHQLLPRHREVRSTVAIQYIKRFFGVALWLCSAPLTGAISVDALPPELHATAARVAPALCALTLHKSCCSHCSEHSITHYGACVRETQASAQRALEAADDDKGKLENTRTLTLITSPQLVPAVDAGEYLTIEYIGAHTMVASEKVTVVAATLHDTYALITIQATPLSHTLQPLPFTLDALSTPPYLGISEEYLSETELQYAFALVHNTTLTDGAYVRQSPLITPAGIVIGMTTATPAPCCPGTTHE